MNGSLIEEKNKSMIAKSFELIELLAVHPVGLTLHEIHGLLKYPKSSIHKIITILYELGYLGKELDSMRYYLSRKLLMLGLSAVSGSDIIERSRENMRQLRDDIGESVMIGTLIDKEVVLLNQLQGNLDFVFILKQGMRFNLYSTAPGKVLLAFSQEEDRSGLLDTIEMRSENKNTITDKKKLEGELDKIVNTGYAADINETVEGVHCIAAPIFDEGGRAVACIWTSAPMGRLPEKDIPQIAAKIIKCGLAVSHNIGYRKSK